MTPEEILTDNRKHTPEELIKAIKDLGSSQKQIKKNLIRLGFKEGDQRNTTKCPVCLYLKSLGFNSPFVTVADMSVGNGELIEIGFDEYKLKAMEGFQKKAVFGFISGLNGYCGTKKL